MRNLFLERLRPSPLLTRRSNLTPGMSLALRIAILLGLLVFIVLFHWLERGSLKDNLDGHVSFADVIYFTMISATTTGYGDVVPVTPQARLFDALVVTPIRIFFLLILAGTAYTFLIKRTWSKWIMRRIQQKLTGHVIVTGFGTSGSRTVHELVARGTDPKKIVVIDLDEIALASAERCGCNVMQADATRDFTLQAARITNARAMMISAGRDDTSILICLTARHLAPDLPISVAVRAEDNEFPAKAAGATCVINPTSFASLLLAGSIDGSGVAEYMADLASASGHVRLHEREIEAFEVGRSLSSVAIGMGLRVLRDGREIGFWDKASERLELGDRIIEVIPEHLMPRVPAG
jgi:voltage-gated potassium channel